MLGGPLHLLCPRGRRLRVAAIAYACLLAQISALAHSTLVQHVTCAEHGESVHLRSLRAAGDGVAPAPVDAQAAEAVLRVGGLPAVVAETHDHCSVVFSRLLTPQGQGTSGVVPAPCRITPHPVCAAATGPGTSTYLIAPKTSPPRPV